ncbi:ABC transporter ATP-binding protein/permease [Saccharopolyspora sp. 6T]|uniref:ABC transporter transmembrane domain-containing protein n=1 Tax=Saccharopolyspora sp. 6T TaxID=2877238 RepID=UPI001CD5CFB9|nr:ABC transporter ATP-binding protein [Saccharopolyspora sp. 6T]MCA1189356.1 ABC transporter ATP-binding protein/permease [Saccharopolyspora sp. 6T]
MTPDPRGPLRLLWSLLRDRPALLAAAPVTGSLWLLPTAVLPLVIGRALDAGVAGRDGSALLRWVLVVLVLGIVQALGAAALSWTSHTLWLHGASSAEKVVLHHVAGLGGALTRRVRTGEVVSAGSADIYQVGQAFEVSARLSGAVVAFLAAAGALLTISPLMAVVALVGVPLATLGIGPLLGPLRRREEAQRENLTGLNTLAADIVSGLRVLRGIGGESRFHDRFVAANRRVQDSGVAAGRITAWLAEAEVLLPGLVTVLVTWLGARMALAGTISAGELVAFYGVSSFLVIPVRTATEAASTFASAVVAADRACALLRLRPEPADPDVPRTLPAGPLALADERTGARADAGELTAVDAAGHGEALAERLARHVPHGPVLAGGVPLAEVAIAELRERIVLAHNQDLLFAGPVRAGIDLGSPVPVEAALHAADAADVLAALPADGELTEQGRALSGGQRQRLLLARALCSDADVLVLDEPTSAVDAHTEARIVRRVRDLRKGRTTIVLTQSPLWHAVADRVVHVTEDHA